MTFYSVGNVIIPTDGVIFFKGVGQPPTSIYIYIHTRLWSSNILGKRWKCPLLISAQTRFVGVPVDDCDDHWTPLKVVFPEVGSRATFFLATMQVSYLGIFFLKSFNWTSLDRLGPIHSFGLHPGSQAFSRKVWWGRIASWRRKGGNVDRVDPRFQTETPGVSWSASIPTTHLYPITSHYIPLYPIISHHIPLSKEVGKQYFRVTDK